MNDTLQTIYQSAVSQIKSDVSEMITAALPLCLSIMGLLLSVKLGVRFFRSIAGGDSSFWTDKTGNRHKRRWL